MKVVTLVLSIVLVACVAVGSAVAGHQGGWHGKGGDGGFHGGRGFTRLLDKLALNADQEREIASILASNREKIGEAVTGIAEARRGVKEAVTAEPYDENAVKQAVQRLSERQEQAALLAAKVLNEVRPVLTAEQKETVKTLSARHAGRMQGFIDGRLERLDDWIAKHNR